MVRKIARLLVLIIGLYLIVSLSRSIWTLRQKGERIRQTQGKAEELRLKNEELKKELGFVQTPEYIERMAREKLNLAKPGETIVILPPLDLSATESATPETPLPNWKRWWKLFF